MDKNLYRNITNLIDEEKFNQRKIDEEKYLDKMLKEGEKIKIEKRKWFDSMKNEYLIPYKIKSEVFLNLINEELKKNDKLFYFDLNENSKNIIENKLKILIN